MPTLISTPGGFPTNANWWRPTATSPGRGGIANWPFYIVYNLFRSAGIIQGVYKRGLDGNASSDKALEYAGVARARAERGWRLLRDG